MNIDRRKKEYIIQGFIVFVCVGVAFLIYRETSFQLKEKNITGGFHFLQQVAGFEISESLIAYSSHQTYSKVLLAGAINTLKVGFAAMFFSTCWAILLTLMLRSKIFILEKFSQSFIMILKNIPLLLQLFFWYSLFIEYFPSVRQADPLFGIEGFFLTNRGFYFPSLDFMTWSWSFPSLRGFNLAGGTNLSPEFCSLLLGLTFYTSTYIATLIHSSLNVISLGQWEAGRSLGLKELTILRLIIFPQALRLIIPTYASLMLSLMKNSSLAVAIAYPDFVSVSNTVINQTGQVIECVFLMMAFYLILSFLTSSIINFYNRKAMLYG